MAWIPLGKHNPRISQLRVIAQGKDDQQTLVEGFKLLRDLWRRGLTPEAVFAHEGGADALERDAEMRSLVSRVPCFSVNASVLARVVPTQSPQGVVAVFPIPRWPEPRGELIVFLDRVQDPANVGAVIRAAAALGADSVVCSPGCANPFSPKAVRASAGTSLLFPVLRDLPFGHLQRWTQGRFTWVAATPEGGTPLGPWEPEKPVVLALGSEGQGLDPEILGNVTHRVTVPLHAGVESLNVAVACGVLLTWLTGLVRDPILGKEGKRDDSSP